jgi:suppressor for copper-sensitivity B
MIRTLVSLLLFVLAALPLRAETASPWIEGGETAVRLLSATQGVGDRTSVAFGLQFRLGGDWKVYWRSAGDAGYPPRPDWSGSENVAEVEVRWPAPLRFSILGIETLGYKHEVVLPLQVTPKEPGKAILLKGKVDYLACADICVPFVADVSLSLPEGPAAPSPEAPLIGRYLAQVPGDGEAAGLVAEAVDLVPGDRFLRVKVRSTAPLSAPDVYLEGPEELSFGPPRVALSEGGRRAVLEVAVAGVKDLKQPLPGQELTVTLVDGGRSAEARLPVTPGTAEPLAPSGPDVSLLSMLALALLGGMILNLMPCVLPVLSLKLLGAVKHGGGERRLVRYSFIASAAGIVAAFMILAGALVTLKGAGAAVGWGIQFQQPWFLAAMALVVTLFACNLWGFFELRLPDWVSDLGEHASHVHGLGGHFLTGMLATLLATPCSAPFLGTAVGFSLARGPAEILAVFAALGVGLASPYLLVAAAPGLATRMPRPGRWMVVLKQVMGVALAGTGLWLLAVLAAELGAVGATAIGVCVLALAAALYLRHRRPRSLGRVAGWAALAFAALAMGLSLHVDEGPDRRAKPDVLGDMWKPFDETAIPRLVAEGKTVFVDVTAEWCITCRVNKSLVLSQEDVRTRLTAPGVVAMQADWTRPDETISRYLARFGRYGIPFNAVYGPALPDGLALPELLTRDTVVEALEKASKR